MKTSMFTLYYLHKTTYIGICVLIKALVSYIRSKQAFISITLTTYLATVHINMMSLNVTMFNHALKIV